MIICGSFLYSSHFRFEEFSIKIVALRETRKIIYLNIVSYTDVRVNDSSYAKMANETP